jgi:hypothetical protein
MPNLSSISSLDSASALTELYPLLNRATVSMKPFTLSPQYATSLPSNVIISVVPTVFRLYTLTSLLLSILTIRFWHASPWPAFEQVTLLLSKNEYNPAPYTTVLSEEMMRRPHASAVLIDGSLETVKTGSLSEATGGKGRVAGGLGW